jgi:hypothetical protein
VARTQRLQQPRKSFSERHGYRPVRSVFQVDSIDEPLKNGLYTALDMHILNPISRADNILDHYSIDSFLIHLWVDHYKRRITEQPDTFEDWLLFINNALGKGPWYEFYDFIDFALEKFPFEFESEAQMIPREFVKKARKSREKFKSLCNHFLEREMSAWRIVGNQVSRLTSDEEIEAVEKAVTLKGPIRTHLTTALGLMSDRKNPDYRNSIKESISAVEAICCQITGKPKADLHLALNTLESKGVRLHGALKKAFDHLYGYTSNMGGVRHKLMDDPQTDFEDAKFMLVSCSAFINLLRARLR